MSQTLHEIAGQAYEAYSSNLNWTNFQGGPLPSWSELHPQVQHAWVHAAFAAIRAWRQASDPESVLVAIWTDLDGKV